ncbi:MAG TPA: DUF4153 domain-containing protein [Clostridia bacterium]|nr:DUF4153 domain-containing protein [Clostridia bacterium]
MKRFSKLSEKLIGLTAAVTRYPVTTAFLLVAVGVNAYALSTDKTYEKAFMSCIVGAVFSAVLQAAYERFWDKRSVWLTLSFISVTLAGSYYLLIRSAPDYSTENSVRTAVIVFAMVFAYMLIPAVKTRVSFNECFMAVFKALFQAILYTAVIFIGCSLIIAAFDKLITPVGSTVYLHTANLVFVLLAPVLFLSLIPVYPGRHHQGDSTASTAFAQEEAITRAAYCPKFLEILISFIIIPLAEIFTVILVLYIFLNIGGDFWRDNLLEPLLISYAIAVMLILFLSARLENRMAIMFRKIFPKILVPIVVFQLFASSFILRDTGVTHPRYFVILFGIFAACAGVILSRSPVQKSGVVAALLIVFSVVSITPPVDAFTVSRLSQKQRLETVLAQYGMLENNVIIPSSDISEADKEKIASAMEYLYHMNATNKLTWLPDSFDYYADFESTFGFSRYGIPGKDNRYISVYISPELPFDISGYDILARASVGSNITVRETVCEFKKDNKSYTLLKISRNERPYFVLAEASGEELIVFDTYGIFSRYNEFTEEQRTLSADQATFSVENDRAKLTIIVQNANINIGHSNYYADCYAMIALK